MLALGNLLNELIWKTWISFTRCRRELIWTKNDILSNCCWRTYQTFSLFTLLQEIILNRFVFLMIKAKLLNLNTYDSYQIIFQAAKSVRKEILAEKKWRFNGSYDGFNVPRPLDLLLRWTWCGPRKNLETISHRNGTEKSVKILSELMMNIIKSNRQIQYDSHKCKDSVYNQMSKTSLTIRMGLRLHFVLL